MMIGGLKFPYGSARVIVGLGKADKSWKLHWRRDGVETSRISLKDYSNGNSPLGNYACADAKLTLRVWAKQREGIEREQRSVYLRAFIVAVLIVVAVGAVLILRRGLS